MQPTELEIPPHTPDQKTGTVSFVSELLEFRDSLSTLTLIIHKAYCCM